MPAELPYTTPKYEVTVERNVIYSQAMGYRKDAPEDSKNALPVSFRQGKMELLDLDMDVYMPDGGDSEKRPLLLIMHGGSFFIGNKDEKGQVAWCQYFASLGYVAACINYRMGFNLGKKSYCKAEDRAVEDADAAIKYLLGRDDLRIDPERIFAAGTSAGAMTALSLAFRLYGDKPMKEVTPRLPAGFRIRGVANLWGSVHDLSVLENARVPILSFQSTADPVMPYDFGYPLGSAGKLLSDPMYGTHAVHEKALELGLRAEHHPCPERGHRIHLDDALEYTPIFYEIRDTMAEFFAKEME